MPRLIVLSIVSVLWGSTAVVLGEPWEERLYDRCLNELFRRPEEDSDFRATRELIVTLRVSDDCGHERQVSLFQDRSAGIQGLALSLPEALRQQLLTSTGGDERSEDRCGSVVKKETRIEGRDADLRRLADKLRALEISPVLEPVIYLHGVDYQIWTSSVGSESYFRFSGASSGSGVSETPLESWAREFLVVAGLECPQEQGD